MTGSWQANPNITIGSGCSTDEGVVVGYMPARKIKNLNLVIGDGAVLRRGTIIYLGSSIGKNLETGHNVIIREENIIGDHLRIWSNSVIDYGCKLGSRVRIHTGCYICQFAVIEDDVFIAPNVALANDKFPVSDDLVGPIIKKGARIGINSAILPGVTVGEGSLVGAGSVVTKDVPPGCIVAGSPARIIKHIHKK